MTGPDALGVEDLEARLEEEETSLRINQQQNAVGVLEAYEKRAQEINEVEGRMAERQAQVDGISAQITHFRRMWEPRLEGLIAHVSNAFWRLF